MGNFSISHHAAIHVEGPELRIRLRIDLAEIPTQQEKPTLDTDGDGKFSPAEQEAYLAKLAPELTKQQSLTVDGQPVPLTIVASEMLERPGAADLPTLLITVVFRAPLASSTAVHEVIYRDNSYDDRTGWREMTVTAAGGARVVKSDAPAVSRSHELEAYPTDLSFAPPTQREARATIELEPTIATTTATTAPATTQSVVASQGPTARNGGTPQDRFTQLISHKELSLGVVMLALASALVFGAFHALAPGHGKTVVAAYLVGSRGTARHAVLLGVVVTFTHVIAVFLLGVIVLSASKSIVPERVYPWLGFVSGILIVAIGLWQFVQRFAAVQMKEHSHGGVAHSHSGGWFNHDHTHGPGGHTHEIPDRITLTSLITLGVSGGIVPCPSALVVMLSAIALKRIALGLTMIVFFSVGLAATLIAIGLVTLYARRLLDRFDWESDRSLLRKLPIVSSALIAALGFVIAIQSLMQGGIIQINLTGKPAPAALVR